MLLHPTFFPFQRSAERAFNPFSSAEDSGPIEPASMLNAEKLALSPSTTTVGTQVSVTDGFVVSGFGDARDGFYFPSPTDATIFIQRIPFVGDGSDTRAYSDGTWHIGSDALGGYTDATAPGGTNPWDRSYSGLTLTHPVVQQLAAPSTDQGGVFVSGGTLDGIYTDRGSSNDKDYWNPLGAAPNTAVSVIVWTPAGRGLLDHWSIINSELNNVVYYSESDVATPDLATDWKNLDGSAAGITVTSVTQGEIVAGLFVSNDGGTNGSSYVSQGFHGRQYYMGLNGGGSNNMHWDTDYFIWTDDVGLWSDSNVAFPWQGADAFLDHNGATFARNNVAAESNWQTA